MTIGKWTALVNGCREKMRESFGEFRPRYVEVELFVDAVAVHEQLLENIQHCCGIFFYAKPALQMVR